jgi:acyl carrier protein
MERHTPEIGGSHTMISSRTPEGLPNRCPVCRGDVRLAPSAPWGDAPCPKCGALLWFVTAGLGNVLVFEYQAAEELRERALEVFAERIGVSKHRLEADPSLIEKSDLDSLDLVELWMDIEEEFDKRD